MSARRATPRGDRPPSVDRLAGALRLAVGDALPHEALVGAARETIAAERLAVAGGEPARSLETLAADAAELLAGQVAPPLEPVINATGVIVHTNLGRAPWPAVAIRAAEAATRGSLFLELDRGTGRRGARFREAERHLIALTGAADALIVNNNAAAVALTVGLAGRGRGVVVSRGELLEIGGGVRIPDIVRRAGARLVEVGTTNRTRVADFEEALATGLVRVVLRVHPSNFRQIGFTEQPDARALAEVAHAHGAIVVDDLGSGALLSTAAFGLAAEPTPGEALAAGADLVTFSGDKLLGGPQAGLIVGRADLVGKLRRDPLARALRPDKVTLAALAATLALYRSGRAATEIPVWRMIAATPTALRARAEALVAAIGAGQVVELESTVGGGSLPGDILPSVGLGLEARGGAADRLLGRLRAGDPPVVGRIEGGSVVLDLRTVEPADDGRLGTAVRRALDAGHGDGPTAGGGG